jgi:clan AA aspartic protease (TIGR02281 family)
MKKITTILLICLGVTEAAKSQCISGDCQNGNGVYLYQDKSRYEGEFKNGDPTGKGKIFYASGAIFEGSVSAGLKNGFGKYRFSSNDYYEGNFKNDKLDGQGKYVTAGGDIYEGQFKNDKLNGKGTITFNDGDKYSGNLLEDQPDGIGIFYYSTGDRFEGTFTSGKKNGSGILYYSKGGTLKGIWVDNVYVSGSNKSKLDPSSIQLNKSLSGIYEVPILINGVLKIDMIFDTGAAEVYLTPDVILTLIRTKTITEDDILDGKNFVDANGNVNKSLRFNLKEIKLGNYSIENVPCAVSQSLESLSLLGLSAIKKLGKIEINFKDNTLKVVK